MADYTIKRFDEMEPILGGFFLRARASLGASSFGMQILQMPPSSGEFYPNHDHADTGAEEVYVEGVRILALGGVPGAAYSPPAFTELGGPEPVADPARIA